MPRLDHDQLRELFETSDYMVAFTGAGISTESGIPDFRSPGGIWTKMQPIDFRDFMGSEEMRKESWRRKIGSDGTMANAQPNRGHRALAELVNRGICRSIITQNVDGLHQASGVADDRVIELHGNATYARCLECMKRYELGPIVENFKRDEILPICDACGGIIKTATISFGQAMPLDEMQRSEAETDQCDLFLATGSSLVVYPAAGFPALAKRNGARLVILNRESTDLDTIADLVIHDEIGVTLGAAVGVD
ncbi:MAG: Sir2 family NAD-dependent protein deacetylase [Acidobacteriota bacterium]|nr:Sir2 family NAD-dependent protein deacetylase [Acidobacteriota bacterium]